MVLFAGPVFPRVVLGSRSSSRCCSGRRCWWSRSSWIGSPARRLSAPRRAGLGGRSSWSAARSRSSAGARSRAGRPLRPRRAGGGPEPRLHALSTLAAARAVQHRDGERRGPVRRPGAHQLLRRGAGRLRLRIPASGLPAACRCGTGAARSGGCSGSAPTFFDGPCRALRTRGGRAVFVGPTDKTVPGGEAFALLGGTLVHAVARAGARPRRARLRRLAAAGRSPGPGVQAGLIQNAPHGLRPLLTTTS